MVPAHERSATGASPSPEADHPTRADALRRFAAEVSGRQDLAGLFDDVIDESFTLFGVDAAGLWTYDGSPVPLRLAAQRGLGDDILETIATLPRDAPTAGMEALRRREVRVIGGDLAGTLPDVQRRYLAAGIRTICYVPIVFGDEPLGMLALYHTTEYAWTADETELARAFADHMATAISNAHLADSTRTMAERLRAISELAGRLNRLQDAPGVARAMVAEARRLIDFDTIRVYAVDHEAGMCEPIAFRGKFQGGSNPDVAAIPVPIGTGLVGWVAAHGKTIRIGDSGNDPRAVRLAPSERPDSVLLVPMTYERTVRGVLVVSKHVRDWFDADDETTLNIFAGYATHAMLNATNMERLRRQQVELEHQLDGQRRLLDVNERLLSTLEPAGVLDLIADSLKAIVPYDTLSIYRIDRAAGVRRAVIARDRFADLILSYEGSLKAGISGWVIEHGEAVLANEAHLDPRSIQVPGTPFEPEAMIVVPLLVNGEAIGSLNIGRMGGPEAHFTANEFELTQLFAGQASIALQNAEIHGAVRVRAEHDALTGLRNHGSFQRELGEAVASGGGGRPISILMLDLDAFKAYNDARGHPAGDALLAAIAKALTGATRDGDRLYRYGGDEFVAILPGADRQVAHEVAERIRHAVAGLSAATDGPPVTISVGVACYPDDGRTKDALVGAADRALYLNKPVDRSAAGRQSLADPYLRALGETALALLDGHDPADLVETIMTRATALLGTPHCFIYLVEPGEAELVVRHGTGMYVDYIGRRMPVSDGLAGLVFRTAAPVALDDYDAWPGRSPSAAVGTIGALVGVPLMSAGRVAGVLGLASGGVQRSWGQREVDALTSFAQLASIALDNARLVDAAQRGAFYDPTTGLPNRELLTDRIARALSSSRPERVAQVGVVLLDIDRFKVINESVGHTEGDRLLVDVGQRLVACLRPGDTVARFGGDEFGIILDEVADADEAHAIAERIGSELRAPFPAGAREWFISASIGISLGRPGRATPAEMLRQAEIALVRAKSDPSNRHALFEPSMSDQTIERIDLENDLRRGIERGELRLHYQPLIDLATDRIVGFEALVRWQHPVRGLIPPLAFIALAEETGLILPLGRWVLETACRQARAWRGRPNGRALFMSVNLSARQFVQPDLVDQVAAVLHETGLDPGRLEIEITESVLMDQSESGVRTLARLRELGVRLVVDDFGTGYSSLSYLKHLPLDTIKIDRSFIAGLDGDTDRWIIEAVVALARGLRMGVIAEGIETEAQFHTLREIGCDVGQGYLFSGPLPANEAVRLLSARRSGSATRAVASSGSAAAPSATLPRAKARAGARLRRPIPIVREPGR